MRRPWLISLACILALAFISLLAVGFRYDPNSSASTLVNHKAPPFTLRSSTGKEVSLAEFRGHPVVLNFWATWCPACLTEHPNLVSLWRRYAPRGVVFVGITFKDSAQAAAAFQRIHGGSWQDLDDPGTQTAIAYGVTGPPETVLIDRDGVVRFKASGAVADGGAVTPAAFARRIDKVLRVSA